MSNDTPADGARPILTPAEKLALLTALPERSIQALVDLAEQQVALEDHVPPRRTSLHVVGEDSVDIPCGGDGDGACMWKHDGRGGVACQTDGCQSWAREGMELFVKVTAAIGPA